MIEFTFPSLGADMDEGVLVSWLVEPGDVVHRGDVVAEVETDKGLVEIESWQEGVVSELVVQPGPDRIPVGTTLALFEPLGESVAETAPTGEAEEAEAPEAEAPEPEETQPEATQPEAEEVEPGEPEVEEAEAEEPARPAAVRSEPPYPPIGRPEPEATPTAPTPAPIPPSITPPVRHLAHQLGVDESTIVPSDGETITRDDVYRAAREPAQRAKASPMARRTAEELGVDLTSVEPIRPDGLITSADVTGAARRIEPPAEAPHDTSQPVAPSPPRDTARQTEDKGAAMRRAVARSMTHSKREIPHYYLGTHVDLDRTMRWVEAENDVRPLERRLLPAALLMRATALAAREVPELNGYWIDDHLETSDVVHLGVAVSLRGGGLVAPAIHDADQRNLDEIMEALRDLVNRARTFRIRSSEMSDPTITVTNLGDRGVETTFPVIVPPQVAIVGFGKIVDQPVAVDGMLAVHPVVHVTLAGDHRATDGHRGGTFLAAIDDLLQEPQDL